MNLIPVPTLLAVERTRCGFTGTQRDVLCSVLVSVVHFRPLMYQTVQFVRLRDLGGNPDEMVQAEKFPRKPQLHLFRQRTGKRVRAVYYKCRQEDAEITYGAYIPRMLADMCAFSYALAL